MKRRGVEMEFQRKNACEEIPPKLDSVDVDPLSVSMEERKREASKPLYLTRYE
ncbi:MAG: hypothetical protein QW270_05850 [Candidatus Bathyarchaeia archaeon]